jgi:serine/threonine protein kinase
MQSVFVIDESELSLQEPDGRSPPRTRGPEPIAHGSFGVVYRAAWSSSVYAYKIIHSPSQLEAELRVARKVDHPHVIRCVAMVRNGPVTKGYLMSLMDGTLLDLLRRHRVESSQALAAAMRLGAQVARGLAYLHERGIAHRDLHIENVFYELPAGGGLMEARVVIGDWNCSKSLRGYPRHTKYPGAIAITAPECRGAGRGDNVPYDVSSDMFGMVRPPTFVHAPGHGWFVGLLRLLTSRHLQSQPAWMFD